jgi:hypothetical protein
MEPPASNAEWQLIERLLPSGWQQQARHLGAFRRVRYTQSPTDVLRLLLLHAVNKGGLRDTVTLARLAGVPSMSMVALFKRMRTAGPWLRWIAAELCQEMREQVRVPQGMRPRAIDSTTIQGPGSKGTEWRLHYTLDLRTLVCDWHELTTAQGSELLERAPIERGDVLLGDRNFLRPAGVRSVRQSDGHVLVRLRWCHPALLDAQGNRLYALDLASQLSVVETGSWPVWLRDLPGEPLEGRLVALKLPAPVAQKAEERAQRRALKKSKTVDERSLKATHYVMLFTTLSTEQMATNDILDLYRFRWQIELAFKRLKQILRLGQLPHKDPEAAQSWILAKLVVALLLETLYRNARTLSPWGYQLEPVGLLRGAP